MPPTTTLPTTSETKPNADGEARLLESRDILSGHRWLRWHAPGLARRVQPGQLVHVLRPRPHGLLLPAVPIAGFDHVRGTLDMLLSRGGPTSAPLLALRQGDAAVLAGPIGRGFEIDARSRYLLLVADGEGFARVRAVVDEAVASGRQVTLLFEAPSVSDVMPSSLLPDEVEYVVATADGSLGHEGSAADLLPTYEAWADQCFAAGSAELVGSMAALAKGRDARMGVARLGRKRGRRPQPSAAETRRKAWLQVALPHEAGCALGVCLGCVVAGSDGPVRLCREGPAFAAAELRWEPSA
jgi:dihydroorotate dehydrogenase electron transfer subunit